MKPKSADVDWMARLICFFVPPVALFLALIYGNVTPEHNKDALRAAGLGVLFYVVCLMLLLSIG
jgi:hypothetical protein